MSYLKIKIDDDFSKELSARLKNAGHKAAHTLADTIKRETEPFVPTRTKSLVNRTQVVDNVIIYPGPYARYLYYGKVMVYTEPAIEIKTPDGKIIKTHYGQRKSPIDKPLKISRAVHLQATDHWLEASKAQNLKGWIEVAGKAVERELKR